VTGFTGLPVAPQCGQVKEAAKVLMAAGYTLHHGIGSKEKMKLMRIGELARATGISTQAIRFYEREGLLPPARRGANGYRCYDSTAEAEIRFIRACLEAGFTLKKTKPLLRLQSGAAVHECAKMAAALRTKLARIETQMAALQTMRGTLKALLTRCEESAAGGESCGALDTLLRRT
jgi:DNA-binding transcriptional MerR regulator